jgi:hypothetical protein
MSEQTLPPFKVGQIVYLIPTGERRVLPAQITEEILRRTVKGTETVWMIQIAGSPKNVPLDPDAAEYFTDMASLRDAMLERTRMQVISMLERVEATAQEIFQESIPEEAPAEVDSETATITMPDGTKARVRI